MTVDPDFEQWWSEQPVSEFEGVDAGHVELAFSAGRRAEREACAKVAEWEARRSGGPDFVAIAIRKRTK